MFKRAIVRAPSTNFAEGLTTVDLGPPNYELALAQHEAYCTALEQCGLQLVRLEADRLHPDSTFVEDIAVLTQPYAVLTRPGEPSRIGEVRSVSNALAKFYSPLHFIRDPGTLEGGDICQVENHFFIGISERTNEAGADQLAELLESLGYTSRFVDIHDLEGTLHLKSALAYLGDNRLVVTEDLVERIEFQSYELIQIDADEASAANCLRVNDYVLIAAGFPVFEKTLRELDYQTIALDMSEFQKMDGGVSCLSLRF